MSKRTTTWLGAIGLCMAVACAGSPSVKPQTEPPLAAPPDEPAAVAAAPAPFARCQAGRCTFDFTIDLTDGGRDARIVIDRCVDPVPNCETNVGRLTPAGRAAAVAVRDALSQAHIEEATGCLGCADGPVYELVLFAPGGGAARHRYDPLHDSLVPESLRPAHALIQPAELAVGLCKPNENVELTAPCSPRR